VQASKLRSVNQLHADPLPQFPRSVATRHANNTSAAGSPIPRYRIPTGELPLRRNPGDSVAKKPRHLFAGVTRCH
jgi:hypothetical protein